MRIQGRPWNKETLFARLEEICSPEGVQAARRLYSYAEARCSLKESPPELSPPGKQCAGKEKRQTMPTAQDLNEWM
jgi:hypothetical protein